MVVSISTAGKLGLVSIALALHCTRLDQAQGQATSADRKPMAEPKPVEWRTNFYCGVNCLYVALKMQGLQIDYDNLCKVAKVSDQGTSLAELTRLSTSFGMPMIAVRATPETIAEWPLPAILHQQRADDLLGHYVLFLGRSGDTFTTLDCTSGQISALSQGDFLDRWSGNVLLRSQEQPLISRLLTATWVSLGLCVFCLGVYRFIRRPNEEKASVDSVIPTDTTSTKETTLASRMIKATEGLGR